MDRIVPQLDFVRALAVLLVFMGHLVHTLGYDRAVGTMAHFGVLLFFIHTALVLFLSLERIGGNFKVFYIRRVLRIYPLSVLVILLALAFRIPATSWGARFVWPGWIAVSSNLLLIQNLTSQSSIITVLWSLPYEVQMYALLPVLFVLYRRGLSVYVMWISLVILAFSFPPNHNLLLYGPCFGSGLVSYRIMKRNSGAMPFRTLVWALAGLILLNQIFALCSASLALTHSVVCILAGFVIGRSSSPTTEIVRKGSSVIAKYSYGIYLSHIPLMWLFFRHHHGIWQFAGFAMGVVVVPFLAFHLVEAPLIRLGRVLTRPAAPVIERSYPRTVPV